MSGKYKKLKFLFRDREIAPPIEIEAPLGKFILYIEEMPIAALEGPGTVVLYISTDSKTVVAVDIEPQSQGLVGRVPNIIYN